VPTHLALLRGVNNLGGKKVAMTELREVVTSLGHTDVTTYPRSELRRVLAKAGGPTSAQVAGTARNWATVSRLLELCRP